LRSFGGLLARGPDSGILPVKGFIFGNGRFLLRPIPTFSAAGPDPFGKQQDNQQQEYGQDDIDKSESRQRGLLRRNTEPDQEALQRNEILVKPFHANLPSKLSDQT
jgi:hypothetical protein